MSKAELTESDITDLIADVVAKYDVMAVRGRNVGSPYPSRRRIYVYVRDYKYVISVFERLYEEYGMYRGGYERHPRVPLGELSNNYHFYVLYPSKVLFVSTRRDIDATARDVGRFAEAINDKYVANLAIRIYSEVSNILPVRWLMYLDTERFVAMTPSGAIIKDEDVKPYWIKLVKYLEYIVMTTGVEVYEVE